MANAFKDKQFEKKEAERQLLVRRCRELADKGHTVDAIKEYRSATGCSLQAARQALGR